MAIAVITCNCGSTTERARRFLERAGYADWLSIPILKGKEQSKKALVSIPRYPEVEMLDNYLQNASKWVVIIGWNENGCRWADIAHNANKSEVEARLIVKIFA